MKASKARNRLGSNDITNLKSTDDELFIGKILLLATLSSYTDYLTLCTLLHFHGTIFHLQVLSYLSMSMPAILNTVLSATAASTLTAISNLPQSFTNGSISPHVTHLANILLMCLMASYQVLRILVRFRHQTFRQIGFRMYVLSRR